MNSGIPQNTILIDFQKIFSKMLSAWWLFIICFGIAIGLGKLYLRYTTFEYSSRAILLIKDAGNSGNISAESILLSDQGLSGGKAMDNEIQILKSLTLMEKVVDRLELDVEYFRIGQFKETELYKDSPFLVDSIEMSNSNISYVNFQVVLEDYKSFVLKENAEDEGRKCYFGIPFETNAGKFLISLNPEIAILKGEYRLIIKSIESAAYSYKSGLRVERIGDQNASSVLQLIILNPVSKKARDILNTLIDVYNEEEIKDENKVLENTLEFIDNRVKSLVTELDEVESGIQNYKSKNEIISNTASGSMDYTLNEIRSAVQQISSFEIQKDLLLSLEGFLIKEQTTFDLIPANLIAESPVLSGLVNQYNNLVLQNKKISTTASAQNPTRILIEEQIVDLRKLILETIQNLRQDLQIPINEIELNIKNLKSSMSNIPGLEKKLIEKMRTQSIKENLFLYLLQKREETALSEAVTTAKTRTIDRARASNYAVFPKRKLTMMVSGILGLVFPMMLVLLATFLDNKIDSDETIKSITNIPILGRIAQRKGDENIVVKYGSRSAINEMFRLLRTNLNFLNHNKPKQTMLLTSSISGEGKTFIAINLAISFALSGKKVILLGMDLRKPKMAEYLNVGSGKGITNYLIGQSNLEEIIQPYSENPNLSFIACGPTPPNPAELILSNRMEELLMELKDKYDYVLIDTPPIGLVSDALLLRKFVDNILIIVHQRRTRRGMLKNLENMYSKNELQHSSIIFNGVKSGKSYYGYGGYGNGYNQGYYVDE
ncbi:MAG: GumC family protein [Saprospiraceae bacterium]